MNTVIRKAITQARFNIGASKVFSFQILLVSALIAISLGSWWCFLIIFFGLSICCGIPFAGICLVLGLSSLWGFAGYSIAVESMQLIESLAIGVMAFLVGLGINFSGLTGLSDLS